MNWLGAVTSGLGTVAGLISNSQTNSSNQKINQQNIEFQREQNQLDRDFNSAEAEKNRNFQQQMQEYQNQWNSASSQRQRLEEAGLNPYLMMNGGSAGTASGSTASGAQASSSSNGAPSMIPNQSAAGVIMQGAQQFNEAYLQQVQADNVKAQTADILAKLAGYKDMLPDMKAQLKATVNSINQGIQTNLADQHVKEAQARNYDKASQKADKEMAILDKELSYMDENQSLKVRSIIASIAVAYSQKYLNYKSASKMIAETLTENATRDGKVKLLKAQESKEFWSSINEFLDANTSDEEFNSDTYSGAEINPKTGRIGKSNSHHTKARHRPSIDAIP